MAKMIEISIEDLQQLTDILASVQGSSRAYDIGAAYRELSNDIQWSPMTRAIERQIQRLVGLIEAAEEEKEKDAKS